MFTTNQPVGGRTVQTAARDAQAHLPEEGFIDEEAFLALLPIGRSTFWVGIKDGRYPKPVKISARKNGWHVGAVRALFASINSQTSESQHG